MAKNPWDNDPIVSPAANGPVMVPVGPQNPKFPYEAQQIQGQIAQTGVNTVGQQIDNNVKGASAPAIVAKAGADAGKAGVEAASAARLNGLPPAEYAKALAQWNASLQLDRVLADLHTQYAKGPGATHGLAGLADFLPSPANQAFDNAGNQARGIVRNALGLGSGENNTATEMNMNTGAYIPQASQWDSTIVNTMNNLAGVRDNARRQAIQILGGVPDAAGRIQKLPPEQLNALLQPYLASDPLTAAPAGSTQQQIPIPPDMQREYNDYLAKNANRLNPDDYVQFRSQLDQKYGFPITPEKQDEYRAWATHAATAAGRGGTIPTTIPGPTAPMSGVDQFRNNMVNNPLGAAAVGAADAGSIGALQLLAGDRVRALGDSSTGNAIGMGAGQVLGSIAATEGLGLLGRNALTKLTGKTLANTELAKAMRTLGVDTAYSGAYGANSGQDPFLSALAGGTGSALGQTGGKALGTMIGGVKASPAVQYLRTQGIPLTVGQTLGKFTKGLEDAATSIPGIGDMINARRLEGMKAFNQIPFQKAAEPIGATAQNIGEQGIYDLLGVPGDPRSQGKIGQAYNAATAGVNVPLDPQFATDMAGVRAAGQALPNDYVPRINAAIDNRIGPIAAEGQITGDTYQQATRGLKGYRASAGQAAPGFEQDYKDVLSGAMGALRGQMERGGGQSVIDGLANADRSYSLAQTIKKAMQAAKNGSASGEAQIFTPAQLNTAATQTANKFGGQRPFADLIDAGQEVLPSKLNDSGTAKRLAVQALVGGGLLAGGTGAGYAVGDPGSGAMGTLATAALLALGGTKKGQSLLIQGLLDRPDWAAKLGASISKHKGLAGAAAIPRSLEASK